MNNFVLSKISLIVFLLVMVSVLIFCVKHFKNRIVQNMILLSLLYALVAGGLLMATYPGLWSWDDVAIVTNAMQYDFTPWQHFMSGLWHTICLGIIPSPVGVLIIQIIVASLIVGYCISNVSHCICGDNRRKRYICQALLFLPTIAGPVVMYLLTGYRMGIYSFLELLLITKLYLLIKQNSVMRMGQFLQICVLLVIVAAWRSEAIYYPVLVFLLFLTMGKRRGRMIRLVAGVGVSMLVVVMIGKWNDKLIGTDNYSVSATVLPVAELVKTADRELDREELQAIDRVLVVSDIYENDGWWGEAYLWNCVRQGYTSDDLNGYYRAYVKLALKYPWTVIRETGQMFVYTSGILDDTNGFPRMRTVCSNTDNSTLWLFRGEQQTVLPRPLNEQLRECTIRLIACIDEEGKTSVGFHVIWNLLIPIGVSAICLILCACKRKWSYCMLLLCVLGRVPLVILTACAPYFMYYISVYLVSYFLTIAVLFETITEWRARRKHE